MQTPKGSTLIKSLLIVIALLLVCFGGYFIYDKNNDNKDSVVVKESKTSASTTDNAIAGEAAEGETKYAVFEDSNYSFTFQYPKEWEVKESDVAHSPSDIMLELFKDGVSVMSINNFSLGFSPPYTEDELELGLYSLTKYTFTQESEGFFVYIDNEYLAKEDANLRPPYPVEFLVRGKHVIEDAEYIISSVQY